jgi:hypothetical protein
MSAMSAKTEKEEEKRLKVLAAKEKLKVTHPGLTYTKRAVCRVDKEMDPEKARELAGLLDRQQKMLRPKRLLDPDAEEPSMGYAPGVWQHAKELSPEELEKNKDWDEKRDDEADTEREMIESLLKWDHDFQEFETLSEEEQITKIAQRFQGSLEPEQTHHVFLDRSKFIPEELQWALQKVSHAYLVKVGEDVKDG